MTRAPLAGVPFESFCLGTGCMEKCRSCQHEANWATLNEMPDALRKSLQAKMQRVDESFCQISSGRLYVARSSS